MCSAALWAQTPAHTGQVQGLLQLRGARVWRLSRVQAAPPGQRARVDGPAQHRPLSGPSEGNCGFSCRGSGCSWGWTGLRASEVTGQEDTPAGLVPWGRRGQERATPGQSSVSAWGLPSSGWCWFLWLGPGSFLVRQATPLCHLSPFSTLRPQEELALGHAGPVGATPS